VLRTSGPDFAAILRLLVRRKVDFIVVGGVCGVLHGAPINTFDLDLVHSRERANVRRLLAALKTLRAYYRTHPEKRLKPGVSHLVSPGHQLLMTRFGPLDLLGTIGRGHGYEDLLEHAAEMQIGRGLKVRLLSLAKLIEVKQETAGDKDRAVMGILRRTLEQKPGPAG
jgi:hypothetical protein